MRVLYFAAIGISLIAVLCTDVRSVNWRAPELPEMFAALVLLFTLPFLAAATLGYIFFYLANLITGKPKRDVWGTFFGALGSFYIAFRIRMDWGEIWFPIILAIVVGMAVGYRLSPNK